MVTVQIELYYVFTVNNKDLNHLFYSIYTEPYRKKADFIQFILLSLYVSINW